MAPDDGYREIQLNGKQLIFLFMATTIVAVVIFLCGVTVGRGVRNASRATEAAPPAVDIAAAPADPATTNKPAELPPLSAVPPTPPPEPTGTAADAAEARTDAARAPGAAPEKTVAPKAPAAEVPNAASAGAAAPAVTAAAGQPSSEPAGEGFAVQVVALSDRAQAEARARDLVGKGYAAYVVAPPAAGGMFRVRIGKFKERRQAEDIRRRLVKEEKGSPFIVPPTR